MDRVKGKVAIVTGGAGGLGKAHSLLLAKEGAKVVVTDMDEAQAKRVADEINKQGGEAIFIKHDVSKEVEWSRVIRETLERFGKLDILVNNAGVNVWKHSFPFRAVVSLTQHVQVVAVVIAAIVQRCSVINRQSSATV